MSKVILYHGSNLEVSNPQILINGYYKDFGYASNCILHRGRVKHIDI